MYRDFQEYTEKILIPLSYVPAMPPLEQIQMLNNSADDVGARFNEIAELRPLDVLEMYDLSAPVQAAVLIAIECIKNFIDSISYVRQNPHITTPQDRLHHNGGVRVKVEVPEVEGDGVKKVVAIGTDEGTDARVVEGDMQIVQCYPCRL